VPARPPFLIQNPVGHLKESLRSNVWLICCLRLLLFLQVSSPVSAAEVSANPLAMTADGNIFERLWNKVPKTKPISDDTYGKCCRCSCSSCCS
jgi:uncharacterized membrane protein